jgi:hypothetical protein
MWILSDWKYVPAIDPLFNAQVIIGMSFGANLKGKGQHPGVSNEEIARIIHRLWLSKNLPVIVQREVAEAMAEIRLPIRPDLVVSESDNQFHISSYEVFCQAWKYCSGLNMRTAVIVAHPAHILRCAAIAGKIGFTVRLPDVSSVPYELQSTQWWTRNRFSFFIWELYARIGGKLKGYL